jgi:hypothetical protein
LLERLRDLLQEGGTHLVSDLAAELDTSAQLVEMMLDDLVRTGSLAAFGADSGPECQSCPLAHRCARMAPPRIWVLAEG